MAKIFLVMTWKYLNRINITSIQKTDELFKTFNFPYFFITLPNAKTLNVGSEAPIFSLLDENGERWHSGDFLNKKNILIFFYPAAMTGGCTKQACAYRDDLVEWKSRDFEIVGISGDKSANLKLLKGLKT